MISIHQMRKRGCLKEVVGMFYSSSGMAALLVLYSYWELYKLIQESTDIKIGGYETKKNVI